MFAYCLREMLVLYYPPFRAKGEEELTDLAVTGIKAYAEDLCEFENETLAEGWRQARRAHKVERWPTISDIRDRCLALAERKHIATAPKPPAAERIDRQPLEKFPHRKVADDWMRTDQGQWALTHGCGPECWDFVAEHGEAPGRDRIADLHREAQARRQRLQDIPGEGQAAAWLNVMTAREATMKRKHLRAA